MFGQKENEKAMATPAQNAGQKTPAGALLTVSGDYAKIEGSFEIADSLEVECEIGGELNVRGRLTIGQNGAVNANVRTVDAMIRGTYEGNMIATGNVEIAATGRVTGNITTDSLVISKGGFFNGNVTRIKEEDKKEVRKDPAGDGLHGEQPSSPTRTLVHVTTSSRGASRCRWSRRLCESRPASPRDRRES